MPHLDAIVYEIFASLTRVGLRHAAEIVDRCRSAALDFCQSASSTVGPVSCKRARCRASVMEILVDRFLRTRDGLVFDLASGSEVVLTRPTAGAGRKHSAWVDRCTALAGIRHTHLAARAGRSWNVRESEHPYDPYDGCRVEDPVGAGDITSSSHHEHPDEGEPCPNEGTTEFAAVDGRADRLSARARRFTSKGLVLARTGRHAGAERLLRQAENAFSRRGQRSDAGRAAFALGRLLLERGHTRDAATAFESARGLLSSTGETPGALRAAVFIGLAWTDEGRLVDAEAALRASRIAAEQIGDRAGASLAQLALARCLLWQGRTDEALGLVQGIQRVDRADRVEWVEICPDLPLDQRSIARRLGARLALTKGNFRAAGASAAAALDVARALARPRELASAYDVLATVQGVIGDLGGLKRYVAEGLWEARKAHTPLRALRLRVTLLEGLVRLNQRREGRVVAAVSRAATWPRCPPYFALACSSRWRAARPILPALARPATPPTPSSERAAPTRLNG